MKTLTNILTLDTETGGLDEKVNGLCSIALSKKGTDVKRTIYIQPQENKVYDDKALEINGLTLDYLRENGVQPKIAAKQVYDFIAENFTEKPMLLGQNIMFDMRFMDVLYDEWYEKPFRSFIHYHFIDTMIISEAFKIAGVFPPDTKTSLVNVYKQLTGKDPERAHEADYDVMMTEMVFDEQLKFLENCVVTNK